MAGRAWETALAERTFVWQRVSPLRDWYELRAADRPLASLGIGGLHFTKAQLDSDDLHLIFTTEGVGERWVRIADADSERVVANFERRWSGRRGTLQLASGGQLEWRRVGWRRPGYVFTDRFSNPLLRFDPAGRVTGYGLGTELEPLIGSWRDLVVLLALGWFLLVVAGAAVRQRE